MTLGIAPPKRRGLLTYEQSAELLKDNQVYLDKAVALDRLEDLLANPRRSEKRGLYICGPEGISKTTDWLYTVEQHSNRVLAKWMLLDENDRLRLMPRRTRDLRSIDTEPFRLIPGTVTPPVFFRLMKQCAGEGELLFLDDFLPLENERLIRLALQGGLDDSSDGKVEMRTMLNFESDDLFFHGCVLVNENRRLNMSWHGKKSAIEMTGRALFDRFIPQEICSDAMQVRDYIVATAFLDTKESGLWEYLIRPNRDTYPIDWPETELQGQRIPFRDRGLGFTGTDDEAVSILLDVLQEFVEVWQHLHNISYRTLRGRLRDHVNSSNHAVWKRKLPSYLRREER